MSLSPGLPEVGARLGDYVLERAIGQGGMGAVFVGRHVAVGARHAIKVLILAPRADLRRIEIARERFAREARALARIEPHPGIVALHSYEARDDGVAYLALDYVEGCDLDSLVDGPLAPDRVLRIGEGIARALAHLHAAGVVHRDLKPANVLIREDDTPVLTDFGVARDEAEDRMTRTHQILGTPTYMAPEQAVGDMKKVGPATDVFALGVTLYQALTGELPFEGDSMIELTHAIVIHEPEPPSSLEAAVGSELDGIVMRCLAKEAADRPSAEAVADALAAVARGEASLLRPSGALETIWRRGKRHRAVLVAGLVGALVLSGALWGAAVAIQGVRDARAWDEEAGRLVGPRLEGLFELEKTLLAYRLGLDPDPPDLDWVDEALGSVRAHEALAVPQVERLSALQDMREELEDLVRLRAFLAALEAEDVQGARQQLAQLPGHPDRWKAFLLAQVVPGEEAHAELVALANATPVRRMHVGVSKGAELALQAAFSALDLGRAGEARGWLLRSSRKGKKAGAMARAAARVEGRWMVARTVEGARFDIGVLRVFSKKLRAEVARDAVVYGLERSALGARRDRVVAALGPLVDGFAFESPPPGAAALFVEAVRAAREAGDAGDCATQVARAVKLDPGWQVPSKVSIWFKHRAVMLMNDGKLREACQLALLATRANMGDVFLGKGMLQLLQRLERDGILKEFEKRTPDDWSVFYARACALTYKTRHVVDSTDSLAVQKSAREALAKAARVWELSERKLPPQVATHLLLTELRAAERLMQLPEFLARVRELLADGYAAPHDVARLASDRCRKEGDLAASVEWARKAVADLEARITECHEGRLPLAAAFIDDELSERTKVYEILARSLLESGLLDEADGVIKTMETKHLKAQHTKVLRGRYYARRGDWDAALAELEPLDQTSRTVQKFKALFERKTLR